MSKQIKITLSDKCLEIIEQQRELGLTPSSYIANLILGGKISPTSVTPVEEAEWSPDINWLKSERLRKQKIKEANGELIEPDTKERVYSINTPEENKVFDPYTDPYVDAEPQY